MQALISNVLNLKLKVTLLAVVVSMLASILLASNSFAANVNSTAGKSVMSADRIYEEKEEPTLKMSASIDMSRSTNLYDHQDGTRGDSLDFRFVLGAALPIGHTLSTTIDYSENLNDPEDTEAGLMDPVVSYGFKSSDWAWSKPYILSMKPSLSTVIPVTKRSVKRDQLQGSLSGALGFVIRPDGIIPAEGAWNVSMSVSAGRNFHSFEENINGKVLNKYSSNQSLGIGYDISDWSFSLSYLHKSRWTYQGNVREAFELAEEIGYGINENLAVNIGHSNAGSPLKANGYESNVQLVDENNSTVYMGIHASM